MSLQYERYLHHFQAGQQALWAGRKADARRELLLASRFLLRLAQESGEPEMRKARKQKGLKLLELAKSLPDDSGSAEDGSRNHDRPSNSVGAEEAEKESEKKWEVDEKPGIQFKDIAGLDDVKDLIRRRVIYPFLNPDLAERYGRRPGGGVLMYGPPGTGKTMMAKAIATELDAPFFNVLCSDIMSKWVGEAEQNLKELFEAARSRLPSVIFLDETEALIGKRGGSSTVMNRLIPEFLAQIDGLKSGPAGMLMLGATNRPWDLDPAALRHGRFGEHVYVGLPDLPARKYILDNTLSKLPLEPDVDVGRIAELTDGLSGADLQGLVDRTVDPAFEQAMETGRPEAIRWSFVERALTLTEPSVKARELKKYDSFRNRRE